MKAFFDALAQRGPAWLDGSGPGGGIVLSTRARLARNLRSFPFPYRASEVELGTVLGDVKRRLARIPALAGQTFVALDEIEALEQRLLVECGLASPELIETPSNRAVAAARDLGTLALINEENHLHLVGYRSGFDPNGALADVLDLDAEIEKEIEPAFDPELGYLTANPAGLGTGLRLSAHVHLPGLVLAGEVEKVCNALAQLQFKVEGLFGKGRAVRGSIFQISNLVTLGLSEEELAGDFKYHVGRLIQHERAARQQLLSRDRLGVEDMAHRNLAVLAKARLMTSQEAVDRLSHVRLALDLGLLQGISFATMNEALCRGQAAHLEFRAGHPLPNRDQAAARADFLRNLLDPTR